MRKFFRDSGHLIRPAVVLLAGLGIFTVIRSAVVPKGFGQYGHYRPGALADNLKRLAEHGINVTGIDGLSAGAGRWGAILWVDPKDVSQAGRLLRATTK